MATQHRYGRGRAVALFPALIAPARKAWTSSAWRSAVSTQAFMAMP
jgi:hypothetical protein